MNRFLRPVHNISCDATEMIGIFEQAYLNIAITMKEAYPKVSYIPSIYIYIYIDPKPY